MGPASSGGDASNNAVLSGASNRSIIYSSQSPRKVHVATIDPMVIETDKDYEIDYSVQQKDR